MRRICSRPRSADRAPQGELLESEKLITMISGSHVQKLLSVNQAIPAEAKISMAIARRRRYIMNEICGKQDRDRQPAASESV